MDEQERVYEQRNGLFLGMQLMHEACMSVAARCDSTDTIALSKAIACYEVEKEFLELFNQKYKELGE